MISVLYVPLFAALIYAVFSDSDGDLSHEFPLEVTLDDRNFGEMKSVCQNFSFGNVFTGEFSTPNYPDLYPADIECVRVIHAPPDHLIHLDFRGSVFEVERSESTDKCQFDYLEVRNGPYGFSPLIGKFCGKRYPPAITGDAGSMWLYFRSDRSLQYKGFKAVHYFSPSKEKSDDKIICSFSNNPLDDDGVFSTEMMRDVLDEIANSTETITECVWKLETASPEQRLRIKFEEFQLAYPNECRVNFLEIYGGNTALGHHLKQFCGRTASVVTTNSHKVYIRIFMFRGAIVNTHIKANYTAYIPGKNCSLDPTLFPCGDDTCISRKLHCNGRGNCHSDSDEKRCPAPILPSFTEIYGPYLVILIVILLIIAIIITCIAVMNLCPRFKKRNVSYAPVPLTNSTVYSQQGSNMSASGMASSMNASNCDMVYSTVVPGPDHKGRLYELLPKMSSEDLHLYLCNKGCLLNGKLPNADKNHIKPFDSNHKRQTTSMVNDVRSPMLPIEKRLKLVDHVDPSSVDSSVSTPPPAIKSKTTPDVVLNGLMKKKKRSTNGTRNNMPLSKSVKFFNADSIDDTSSERNYSSPVRKVSKSLSHPTPLSTSSFGDGVDSSSDTLENLSQVTVSRATDSDDDDDDYHERSPIRALKYHHRSPTSTSPKKINSDSDGFVLSI